MNKQAKLTQFSLVWKLGLSLRQCIVYSALLLTLLTDKLCCANTKAIECMKDVTDGGPADLGFVSLKQTPV